jgi:hypothetical protein
LGDSFRDQVVGYTAWARLENQCLYLFASFLGDTMIPHVHRSKTGINFVSAGSQSGCCG